MKTFNYETAIQVIRVAISFKKIDTFEGSEILMVFFPDKGLKLLADDIIKAIKEKE